MKKAALSFAVVAASAAYIWVQSDGTPVFTLLPASSGDQAGALAAQSPPADAIPPPTTPPRPIPPTVRQWLEGRNEPPPLPRPDRSARQTALVEKRAQPALPTTAPGSPAAAPPPSPATTATNAPPAPRLRPTRRTPSPTAPAAAPPTTTLAQRSGLGDGTYNGPTVNTFFGPLRVEAVVQDGRLIDVRVPLYPSHRRTSAYISRQALPMLLHEVVSAQSARVHIISGATLTSEAFIRSLGAALLQARA